MRCENEVQPNNHLTHQIYCSLPAQMNTANLASFGIEMRKNCVRLWRRHVLKSISTPILFVCIPNNISLFLYLNLELFLPLRNFLIHFYFVLWFIHHFQHTQFKVFPLHKYTWISLTWKAQYTWSLKQRFWLHKNRHDIQKVELEEKKYKT